MRNNPTKAERKLWSYLRGDQFMEYDFHRQKPLGNFIADFYCYQLRPVIEVDGLTHSFEETVEKDKIKQEYVQSLGFKLIRFQDEEVMNDTDNVLRVIEQYILEFQQNQYTTKIQFVLKSSYQGGFRRCETLYISSTLFTIKLTPTKPPLIG